MPSVFSPAGTTDLGRQAGVDVGLVEEGIEGFPVGHRQVSDRGGGGVDGAALHTPAQLLAIGQRGQVVHGHDLGREGELALFDRGRHQAPYAGRAVQGKHPLGTAIPMARPNDASNFVHWVCREVANIEELHDGSFRLADIRGWHGTVRRHWGRERAGVDQAACAKGQCPSQTGQPGGRREGHVKCGAEDGVCQTAPASAVACGVRDTRTDVPAEFGGHSDCR